MVLKLEALELIIVMTKTEKLIYLLTAIYLPYLCCISSHVLMGSLAKNVFLTLIMLIID